MFRSKKPGFLADAGGCRGPVSRTARLRAGLARASFAGFVTAGLTAGVLGDSGCSGTSSSTASTIITGVSVRAETLTGERGCGTAASQVYKYAAAVYSVDADGVVGAPVTAGLFDCFTDVTFVNLPAVNGSSDYRIDVFLYNEPTFTPGAVAISKAAAPATFDAAALRANVPTWSTACTVTQYSGVQTLALCTPVAQGLAGIDGKTSGELSFIRIRTESFKSDSGDDFLCANRADAGSDGGLDGGDGGLDAGSDEVDAESDAQADASDAEAGPPDAGSEPRLFDTVRVRNRVDLKVRDTACPSPYILTVPAGSAVVDFTFDVGLSRSGAPLGVETTCEARVTPGQTVTAVCQPLP